jgi:hypothetical protein
MKKIIHLISLLALPALSFSQITNPAPYCDPVFDINYNMFDSVVVQGNSLNFGSEGSFGNTNTYLYYDTTTFPDFVIGNTASIELNVFAVNDIEPLYFALWIDFDQSNTFDSTELVMQNSNTIMAGLPNFGAGVTSISKSVTIPSGASLGNTRARLMRSANRANPFAAYDNTLILDPCPTSTGMGFGFLGCTYDFDVNIVSGGSVGIIENDFGNEFKLFPNPTSGQFSIDLGNVYDAIKITISDMNGKLIESKSFNNNQLLNLELKESPGIYFLLIKSDNNKAVIRLIKE